MEARHGPARPVEGRTMPEPWWAVPAQPVVCSGRDLGGRARPFNMPTQPYLIAEFGVGTSFFVGPPGHNSGKGTH